MFKKAFLFLLVTVCIFSCNKHEYLAAPKETQTAKPTNENGIKKRWVDNEIIVEWRNNRDDKSIGMIGGSFKKFVQTKAMIHFKNKGFDIVGVPDVESAINILKTNPNVKSVSPNWIMYPQIIYPPLWDSLYKAGQLWDKTDTKVDQVWKTNQGSRSVIVNLIDEGTDPYLDHIYTNIDVPHSHDFLNDDSTIFDGPTHGHHATFTAGQIAGRGGLGMMPYGMIINTKFLEGSGSLGDAIQCMDYITMLKLDSGLNIKVSSNSWGYLGDSTTEMYDAIDRMRQADILFVAAQGNNGVNTDVSPFYPACHKNANVIGVAAKDINQNLASFSNYGATTCTIAAPGVSIPCMDFDANLNFTYSYPSGTSMATPEVAGACGLIAATNPTWNYAQIKNYLMNSCVRPMSSVNGKCITNGTLDLSALIGSVSASDTGKAQPLQPQPVWDLTPPTIATNVRQTGATLSSVTFTWHPGTDPESGLWYHGILLRRKGIPDATYSTFDSTITFTGLPQADTLTILVYEINKQGLQSGASAPGTGVSLGQPDTIPPPKTPNLRVVTKTQNSNGSWQIHIAWDSVVDNDKVYGTYGEGKDTANQQSVAWNSYRYNDGHLVTDLIFDGLANNSKWHFNARQFDRSGNYGDWSDTLWVYMKDTLQPPSPPVIASFIASPSIIDAGQSSTLTWSTSNATSLTIDGSVVNGTSLVVSPAVTHTYVLTATNSSGSATAQTTVTVNQPPPPDTTISITASGKSIIITKSPAGTVEIQRSNRQGGSYSTIGTTSSTSFLITMKPSKWYRAKYGTKISNEIQL